MSDNKSRDIFYGVVAVATLIVALIGATLAYFSMTASSGEGAVSAQAAVVSVNYEDGQNVIAQAKNLIPVTYEIMKTQYQTNLAAMEAQAAANGAIVAGETEGEIDHTALCKNGQKGDNEDDYQVCSVFRFTIKDESPVGSGGTTLNAMLRTENNGFQYLYYAVRDVTAGTWLKLDGDREYVKLDQCDSGTCYTVDESTQVKTYSQTSTTNAVYPINGYQNSDDITSFKTINLENATKTYDVVLFILENGAPQDGDQGKEYTGNLSIETVGGKTITGRTD